MASSLNYKTYMNELAFDKQKLILYQTFFDIDTINTFIWFPLYKHKMSMNRKKSYKQLMFQKNASFFFVLFDKEGYLHFICIKLMNIMDMNYEWYIIDVYRFDSYCIIIWYFQVTRWYFLIHKVQKIKSNFRL